MRTGIRAGVLGLAAALAAAGCGDGAKTGDVSGTVTVDGQVPAEGSSITFIPTDGRSQTAGATIKDGKYSASVPVGTAKVEIRVPRLIARPKAEKAGPGSGGGKIEESLPARYHDKSELKYDVQSGRNEKNWELKGS
ncbi:MAG TPA: hypothetical protein VH092_26705 [Urbifossiella sp.]|jgi:hypothetical protein|nr:hypothetical protein [Urbifossiella sp.]